MEATPLFSGLASGAHCPPALVAGLLALSGRRSTVHFLGGGDDETAAQPWLHTGDD